MGPSARSTEGIRRPPHRPEEDPVPAFPAASGSGGLPGRPPESAIVVGAGMVGLATAWHLQERGVEVTVVDRTGVAAGARNIRRRIRGSV
jgi:NADPH-dependent 2,4-dienoyl-CoA reductase/sulfur reductase-like enzyme